MLLVSGRLAPTLIYEDGCLVTYVHNHIERDLILTNALKLLASSLVSLDYFYRLEMDSNINRLSDNINTKAAEQCFSWLRSPVFMVILFHLKHMSYVRRKPSDIFFCCM
ncbi:unnamed protein product [Adineta steineri]|uniref:Uncharacterized protein n=2 Tax=Adineta steineri TaxID=433720 RepID=A0A813QD44_9BILA|nr:unnamed protein product [Adineta steineri]